jgi:hypothetical protein
MGLKLGISHQGNIIRRLRIGTGEGSCEYGDESSESGATELASLATHLAKFHTVFTKSRQCYLSRTI